MSLNTTPLGSSVEGDFTLLPSLDPTLFGFGNLYVNSGLQLFGT